MDDPLLKTKEVFYAVIVFQHGGRVPGDVKGVDGGPGGAPGNAARTSSDSWYQFYNTDSSITLDSFAIDNKFPIFNF